MAGCHLVLQRPDVQGKEESTFLLLLDLAGLLDLRYQSSLAVGLAFTPVALFLVYRPLVYKQC